MVKARVDSRSAGSAYIVGDSTNATKQTISRDEYDRVAAQQDAYIAGQDMVVVDGCIGPDPGVVCVSQAIVEGTIEWTEDPDFGYEVASSLPGVGDIEILQPRRLYERTGRDGDYAAMVAKMKRERSEYLASFDGLDPSILKSIA